LDQLLFNDAKRIEDKYSKLNAENARKNLNHFSDQRLENK